MVDFFGDCLRVVFLCVDYLQLSSDRFFVMPLDNKFIIFVTLRIVALANSIEGIPAEDFDCFYSPAKRRGPVPGKAQSHGIGVGATRKADAISSKSGVRPDSSSSAMGVNNSSAAQYLMAQGSADFGTARAAGGSVGASNAELRMQQLPNHNLNLDDIYRMGALGITSNGPMAGLQGSGMYNSLVGGMTNEEVLNILQRQQQMLYGTNSMNVMGMGLGLGTGGLSSAAAGNVPAATAAQQQLNYMHQLQAAQQRNFGGHEADKTKPSSVSQTSANLNYLQQQLQAQSMDADEDDRRLRARVDRPPRSEAPATKILDHHLILLSKSSVEGNRLRSYYELSINELLNLPPIPSDEEYCKRLPVPLQSPALLPRFDLAALNAARFAELALGAMVSDQIGLSLELSNATVTCLRECVEEPIHPSCMYDVARAYFLHGLLRSVRGDMDRYFKYRRVCLTHLNRMGVSSTYASTFCLMKF